MWSTEPLKDNSEKLYTLTHRHLLRARTRVTSPTRMASGAEPPSTVHNALRRPSPRGGADQSLGSQNTTTTPCARRTHHTGSCAQPAAPPRLGTVALAHHDRLLSSLVLSSQLLAAALTAQPTQRLTNLKAEPLHGGKEPGPRSPAAPLIGQPVWLLWLANETWVTGRNQRHRQPPPQKLRLAEALDRFAF